MNENNRINELAIAYYNAKSNNDSNEKKRLFWELYTECSKKYKNIVWNDTPESYIYNDAIEYSIDKYDPQNEKNARFTTFLHQNIRFKSLDQKKKDKRLEYEKNSNEMIAFLNGEELQDGTIPELSEENKRRLSENQFAEKEKHENEDLLKQQISIKIVQFLSHKKTAPTKLSYYRIFITERIISIIAEFDDTSFFNKAEAYDCSDKGFVRFISTLEYHSLDELADIRFKTMSNVLPDYEGEDKEIKIPCDNRVVVEYRYVSGFDKKRVSTANVSQYRTPFNKDIRNWLGF